MQIYQAKAKESLHFTLSDKGRGIYYQTHFRELAKPVWIEPSHIDYLFSTFSLDLAIGGTPAYLVNPIS